MGMPQRSDRYRWEEYLSWPTDERFELIDGITYAMSPAPRREHQRLVSEINRQIANALHDKLCDVYPAPFDVKLSADERDEAPTVVQPDLTVICDPSKLTDQGVHGAPDLVIEIVSPDSGYHDRGRKFELYEAYGVAEYWIVDPDECVVEVYHLQDTTYRRIGVFSRDDRLTARVIADITVDLAAVFPRRSQS